MDALTRLNIVSSGFLDLKSGLLERAVATTSLGAHELWSSANLYRHLNLFEASVVCSVLHFLYAFSGFVFDH
jgi:hypothetical protein